MDFLCSFYTEKYYLAYAFSSVTRNHKRPCILFDSLHELCRYDRDHEFYMTDIVIAGAVEKKTDITSTRLNADFHSFSRERGPR